MFRPRKTRYDDDIEYEQLMQAQAMNELQQFRSYNNPERDWAMTLVHEDAIQEADKRIKRLKALRELELAVVVPVPDQMEKKKKNFFVMM